jgi:hypothetical protein
LHSRWSSRRISWFVGGALTNFRLNFPELANC